MEFLVACVQGLAALMWVSLLGAYSIISKCSPGAEAGTGGGVGSEGAWAGRGAEDAAAQCKPSVAYAEACGG